MFYYYICNISSMFHLALGKTISLTTSLALKMKYLSVILFWLSFNSTINAQPTIEWQKCLGGSHNDRGNSIQQTSDSGYIVAGNARSVDGDVTGNHGTWDDYWVVKLNNTGTIEWQKCVGGYDGDYAESIRQTADGGYIVTGRSASIDGDVTGNHGGNLVTDYWVVKLDSAGSIVWEKCLGGTDWDGAESVRQTYDGGYIIAGSAGSNDGDVTGFNGGLDYWIVKLDSSGILVWQKCLGGSQNDRAYSIQQTLDSGYIVAGGSASNDSDVTGSHGMYDFWIVKLNKTGFIDWEKCLGGSSDDYNASISLTLDGGYIVAGGSNSSDGDVTGNHAGNGGDGWVVKLDNNGNIDWQKCYGGDSIDYFNCIQQTSDSGYIISGMSKSINGDVTNNHGGGDCWIVKLNNSGSIEWQKCYGGYNNYEESSSIQQTFEGGFIFTGYTGSSDGDVTGFHGGSDYWVVKLSSTIGIEELNQDIFQVNIFPNPISEKVTINFYINKRENVSIMVYDISGREITTLKQQNFQPGFHSIEWNELNNSNYMIENGIYILSISTQNGQEFKRIEVLR
jgi:hypothetical protein